MKNVKQLLPVCMAIGLLLPAGINAQQASMTIVGLSGQNMTVTGSTVYIPAGGYLNHTGNIYVAANQLIIGKPGTTITGITGGRLHLLGANQLDASVPAAATLLDANGLAFDIAVTNDNPQNLSLTDGAFGTTAADGAADVTFLREFAFGATHPFTNVALTDNHVITNSNRFIIGSSGSLTGYTENRYVVTNNNAGELRKLGLTNGQSFFYPIGRAELDYTPANMQVASGGPVDYFMNVRNFAESNPNESIGAYATMANVSRTWTIYGSNAGSVANMNFIHPGTPMYEVNGYDRTASNVIRFSGNSWIPNTPNDAENQSLFGTPANYWAQQITFAVPATPGANAYYGKSNTMVALPLRLGNFTAAAMQCQAVLNWSTFTEQNLSHFNVERSDNGITNWSTVARVAAFGNSTVVKDYAATDARSTGTEAYYRLAAVDDNGKITYSDTRLVRFNCKGNITGYPNPAHDYFTLLLPQGPDTYKIRVVNIAGQVVLPEMTRAAGQTILTTNKLAAGSYTVIITDTEGKVSILKLIKN